MYLHAGSILHPATKYQLYKWPLRCYKLLQAVVTFSNAAGTLNNAALLQAVADPVGSTLSEHLTALAACCDWTGIRLLCLYVSPPSGPHSASDSAVTPLLLNPLRLRSLPGTGTRYSLSLLPATRDLHPTLSLPAPRYDPRLAR